jgi:hypothetical protein
LKIQENTLEKVIIKNENSIIFELLTFMIMKQFTQFLVVLLLVVTTTSVCFASDVGIPVANHSIINKESPAVVFEDAAVSAIKITQAEDWPQAFDLTTINKEENIFKIPPLAIKHESQKETKAWSY